MRTRPVNLDVAIRATRILRILIVRWTGRLVRTHTMIDAVTRQTQLVDPSEFQQSRMSGAMRRMAGCASFGLEGCMFVSKWPLLVGVALYTRRISAGC